MINSIFESSYIVSWKTKSGNCQIEVKSEKAAKRLFADLRSKHEAKLYKCDGFEIKEIS